ncbi:pyridoxal phosphate-dependent aminotransferase [Pseudoteredinibacter isoporae]|uniref:pyridoxal phosphate-dependent aminotransferase n=1 Tax=Pseudoteredinibacter isoporae TaxID=570281 RepID=UPI0031027A6F
MTFNAPISQLSQRLIEESSGVWAVHDQACEQFANGEDVYLLSVGDPDLATLPSTIRATIDSLEKGRTHYAPGMGEKNLRQIISDIEIKSSGKHCDPSNVVIFPGATNAIYTVMACLLNAGEDVIVAEPMYVGYEGIFKALNVNVVPVELDVENHFELDVERVKAAVTEKTRVVFINTPGNPAGNMISEFQLRELAEFCLENNLWLVCDEVYSMITFDEPHTSLRKAAANLDNVVIIDGLSKSHAMTGWRLGWTVASTAFSQRLLDFTSSTIFGCCQFVQDAAAFALTNDEEYIQGVREEYRQRRNYVCERVERIPGISCQVPKAGMFVMIKVDELAENGLRFAEDLLKKEKVSVLPGVGFGQSTTHYVRVSLAQPINVLKPAFDRIERYAKALLG